jgi:hypothetical protein
VRLERVSLRGIERIFRISRRTVRRWLARWIAHLPAIATTLVPARWDDVLELDELWSFVGQIDQQRWLWLACPGNSFRKSSGGRVYLTMQAAPLAAFPIVSGGSV